MSSTKEVPKIIITDYSEIYDHVGEIFNRDDLNNFNNSDVLINIDWINLKKIIKYSYQNNNFGVPDKIK